MIDPNTIMFFIRWPATDWVFDGHGQSFTFLLFNFGLFGIDLGSLITVLPK